MPILNDLLDSLEHTDEPVRSVCTGAFWTAVSSRHTGLSSTYRDLDLQHSDHPCMVKNAGALAGKPAGELARYALADDTVSASIGMATVNSLIDIPEAQCTERNAGDLIAEKGAGRNIAVIGHFPFVRQLRDIAANLWVIEKRLRPGDLSEEEGVKVLPKADVVCLTSTTLINHTIEGLLDLCRDSYVVLTGPTSPMTPVLFDYGIDTISGSRVTDPETVMRFITEGATFRQVKRHGIRLLTMQKETFEKE